MAQFINIGGKIINLDLVTAMYDGEHDGRVAVTVRFVGDDSYIRFRGTQRDQLLKFIEAQESMEGHLNQMRAAAGVIDDIDFEAIMREAIEEEEDDTRTPEEIAAGEPFPREVD